MLFSIVDNDQCSSVIGNQCLKCQVSGHKISNKSQDFQIVDENFLSTNCRWNFFIYIVEVVEVIVEVVEIIVEVKFQWTKVPKNDINNILEKGFEIKIKLGWDSARCKSLGLLFVWQKWK